MKRIISLSILLSVVLSAGCAQSNKFNFASLMGVNVDDLRAARATGEKKTIPLSYSDAYDKAKVLVKEHSLTVLRTSKAGRYIVVIGIPKQVNTTRVGIFFEPVTDKSTKVTLSSLSDTALAKAKEMVFDKM
ncbi:MAG: hypothetical protein ABIH74_04290 [Candidatus Omnitrophota bacterium]